MDPGEGLWLPDDIELPDPVRRALPAIVRIGAHLRFDVHVHDDPRSAADARSRPGAMSKRFLPGGGVLWPVHTDPENLDAVVASPGRSSQPGFAELSKAWRSVRDAPPDRFVTEAVESGATGFAVAVGHGEALMVTNYHVVREAAERLGRTDGVHAADSREAIDLWVEDGSGRRADHVRLLSNASRQEWQRGEDWALVQACLETPMGLVLAEDLPESGQPLWVLGYPWRTVRGPNAYPEADGSLRVSTGDVRSVDGDIVCTVDGVAGSSGSPALDEDGRVVGIFRVHSLYEDGLDPRIEAYGGVSYLMPTTTPALRHAIRANETLG